MKTIVRERPVRPRPARVAVTIAAAAVLLLLLLPAPFAARDTGAAEPALAGAVLAELEWLQAPEQGDRTPQGALQDDGRTRTVTVEAATGDLRVDVRASDSLKPVPGVALLASPVLESDRLSPAQRRAVTGLDGRVRLSGLAAGEWTLALDRGPRRTIAVTPGTSRDVVFEIEPGRVVRGRVLAANGSPVEGARIWVGFRTDRTGAVVTTSGPDGVYRLPVARTAGFRLAAFKEGHAASPQYLVPGGRAGSVQDVQLRLGATGATVIGTVVDSMGRPIRGAQVTLAAMPEHERPSDADNGFTLLEPPPLLWRTGGEGRFAARGLATRETVLVVQAPGQARHREVLRLDAGSEVRRRIVLLRGAGVRGRVQRADGSPAAGAIVQVLGIGTGTRAKARCDRAGEYELRDLVPGRLQLLAQSPAGRASAVLRGAGGDALVWNVVLDPGRTIDVRVVDAAGRPAAGYSVSFFHDEDTRGPLRTDGGGNVRFTNARDEDYFVTVRRERTGLPLLVATCAPRKAPYLLAVPLPESLASLTFRVADPDGKPIGNLTVGVDTKRWGQVLSSRAENGVFRLGPFPPGELELHLIHAGSPRLERKVDARAGVTDLGTIRLQPHVSVRVSTRGSTPVRLRGLLRRADGIVVARAKAADGTLELRPGGAGDYRLSLFADNCAPVHLELRLQRADEERRVELKPALPIRFLLRETGDDEYPLKSVKVLDARGSAVADEVMSSDEHTVALPPGDYRVEVVRDTSRGARRFTVEPEAGPKVIEVVLK